MRRALAAALLVALVAVAPAAARTPFDLLGRGQVWTDGDRYAVLNPPNEDAADGPALVIDDSTGRRFELAPPQDGCVVSAVAAGTALWTCGTAAPMLQELESPTVRPVPGWQTYDRWLHRWPYGGPGPGFATEFGSRWLEATTWCYHCGPQSSYVDWHSGAFVSAASGLAERTVDLDSAQLDVPLCAPLRRLENPQPEDSFLLFPSTYDRPWLLRTLVNTSPRVRLFRCGRRRSTVVARCRFGGCLSRQLGGGYLTWRDGYRVYGFDLARQRRFFVGAASSRFSSPTVLHTRRNVYVNNQQRAYSAPLRARPR